MRYDFVARLLHWLVAGLLVFLFGLGWYMTGLSYYDPDYRWTVDLHKAVGLVTGGVIGGRLVWRLGHRPPPMAGHAAWENRLAGLTHLALYGLMVALPVTGCLMVTATGQGIDFFGLGEMPALFAPEKGREESFGLAHEILAYGGALLVLLHLGGVFKHHYLDRDATLDRMLFGRRPGARPVGFPRSQGENP